MQPNIWYYFIVCGIWLEDSVQVFFHRYNVKYYWVNRLKIAINIVHKYDKMTDTTKFPNMNLNRVECRTLIF